MTSERPLTDPLETVETVETAATRPATKASIGRGKRVLAVVAGVAMVPAMFAAASAVKGGGARPSVSAAAGADDTTTSVPGTEVETEHGVTTVTPDDSATPSPTTTTTPETEIEHGVPTTPETETEPGDDSSTPAPTPAPAVTQTFSSTGGSIDVTLENGALTLDSVSPAAGFTPEVHDAGGERVEVRFFDAQGKEWRIRIEVAGSSFTQEITFHG